MIKNIVLLSLLAICKADDPDLITWEDKETWTAKEFWWAVNWDKALDDNEGEHIVAEEIDSWMMGTCLKVAER